MLILRMLACNESYPPNLLLDPALTACELDRDCVIVELGKCDACNGGFSVAVNRDSEEEVRKKYSQRSPFGYACTAMGCVSGPAVCDAGTCGVGAIAETGAP